jgi:ketosteroid isomerase-like protein
MTPTEVFHRAHERVRAYDITFCEFFAEDGVLELPFARDPMPRRVAGRAAIRALLEPRYRAARAAGRVISGYRELVIHETRDPEVIVVEFTIDRPDHAQDVDEQTMSFVQIFRVVDDHIVLQRDYFDSLAMAERLRVS